MAGIIFDVGTHASPVTYGQVREGHSKYRHSCFGLHSQQMFPSDITVGKQELKLLCDNM